MQISYFNIIVKKKIKRTLTVSLGLLLSAGFSACNAIFEKDISEKKPGIFLPGDLDTITSNKVHFKWHEMDGAAFYNLQVVQPSFADIQTFVLDSNVSGEDHYQILSPGAYEFRVRGENGGHVSLYAGPYRIYVDSVSDLSGQFVSLISPADEIYVNGTEDLLLSWQNLFATDHFEYILKTGDDFETGSALDVDLNINTLSYFLSSSFLNVEGTYFWGIKGVNTTSSTSYSSRKINVDLTRPNSPDVLSPLDETVHAIDEPITFKWSAGTDPGSVNSPVTSSVEIATSESFIDYEEISGITADSLVYTFSTAGDYWWRVRTLDEAGNVSEFYSFEWQITVE